MNFRGLVAPWGEVVCPSCMKSLLVRPNFCLWVNDDEVYFLLAHQDGREDLVNTKLLKINESLGGGAFFGFVFPVHF